MPRIYEKKEKRSLASGLRTQIQSRKKQGTKMRTFGNELLTKKNVLKKSDVVGKKKNFNEKHSRSFRRKKSQEIFDLKNSFQKSNESFYQKKKNQSLVGKNSRNLQLDTLSLDKKIRFLPKPGEEEGKRFLHLKNLDKVSENEEENMKCGSQESRIREVSSGERRSKEGSRSVEQRKNYSVKVGMKRSTGGKLLKMCIYAKNHTKLTLSQDRVEARPSHTQKEVRLETDPTDEKKFFTLKGKSKYQSPASSNMNDEMKQLYHRRKNQAVHCHSLNTSQKQITSRLPTNLETKPLAESKMIDSKLGSFEEQHFGKPGKMTTSLAVVNNSKNGKLITNKNYSMFQERKEHRMPANIHTPRVSKHDLVKNLYQPEGLGKKYLQSHVHEFSWPVQQERSKDKIRESMKLSKEVRKQRKPNPKNSKKRDNEGSSRMERMEGLFKKNHDSKRFGQAKQRVKKYKVRNVKRMEHIEVKKAVMKDHQHQKAHMKRIIKNFGEGRPKKAKRSSNTNHQMYEPKFNRKEALTTYSRPDKFVHHEPVLSFNNEWELKANTIMNTSVNNNTRIESHEFREPETPSNEGQQKKPKQKQYKTSVQKDSKKMGNSQREIVVPRDFRIFNNKVRSGEGFELPKEFAKNELKKATFENKQSQRAPKKRVFQGVNEKFNNLHEGIHEKMDKRINQILNRRTVWRDKLINNPVSCIKKPQGLRYTKSKKKLLNKPGVKMLVGKFKQSFLNREKFESELDKKLGQTSKKSGKDGERILENSRKESGSTLNKETRKEKTLVKVKSKMKLDRMLKNRNFNHKVKNKIDLTNQFKALKKPVGKNNFNKEEEIEEDKKKYLANFNILHFLGKGSYAEVYMAYDLSKS